MRWISSLVTCASMFISMSALAVVVSDNGSGTGHIPVHAAYNQEGPMKIIDGLPVGTTIELHGTLTSPASTLEGAGGTLGGTAGTSTGSTFVWTLQGTDSLKGFERFVAVPVSLEVHAAPRTLASPAQSFNTNLYYMQGQITGDPDFDLLRVTAGSGFGMPSPGHTTFTQAGSAWAVDSFFDITYRIDFVGTPGGHVAGMSGSTTQTVRIFIPEPVTVTMVLPALLLVRNRRR